MKIKITIITLLLIVSAMLVEASPFITKWDLSIAGTGPTQLTFGVGTSGTSSYIWETIPAGQTGSGTFTGSTLAITGLPAGAMIRLSIDSVNFNRININNGIDRERLLDVEQWGTVKWTSMQNAFYGCINLDISSVDLPDLTLVLNMSRMFENCDSLNGPTNIDAWNTSNVTNMSSMFENASNFNQPIGNWNTSNITDMSGMFYSTPFNQPIGNWNTSNVTDMSGMFAGANQFNQPIGNWNTSNVTDMNGMFSDANNFNQPIGNWNTSSVTNMLGMFTNMLGTSMIFNQPIANWNTSNVTDMSWMFGSFTGTNTFNQPIGNWNTSNVTNMHNMFRFDTSFNQPIGNWNTSNVLDMSGMFNYAKDFNQPIGNWNTSNVVNMLGMFSRAFSFNQPLNTWNTSNVTNMVRMFNFATAFNQPLSSWNLQNDTSLAIMFDYSGMDCANYSNTLNAWNANPNTPNNLSLGAIGRYYDSNAQVSRNHLIGNKGWSITGDALSTSNCGTVYYYSFLHHIICLGDTFNGHTNSGVYNDTLLGVGAMDTIMQLNLTVLSPSFSTITQFICQGGSYLGYTTSGTHIDTLVNSAGCDSIRILNLTVLPSSTSSITQTICHGDSYGGYTTSGLYIDTLINSLGCDSIRNLSLIVLPSSSSSISQTICQGNSYLGYTTSGIYIDTLISSLGCDSIRTLNLTMLPSNASFVNHTICQGDSYLGFASSGVYVDSLFGINGCDSIHTLNLIVSPLPNPIIQINGYLLVSTNVANVFSYQWYYNSSPIGTNNDTLSITQNGVYVVAVTDSYHCIGYDTLNVFNLSSSNVASNNNSIQVYPNPSSGVFMIEIPVENAESISIQITDLVGATIFKNEHKNVPNGIFHDTIDFSTLGLIEGMYMLSVSSENQKFNPIKLIYRRE